jgi:hypothetical protein
MSLQIEETSKIVAHNGDDGLRDDGATGARRCAVVAPHRKHSRALAYAEGVGLTLGELVPRMDALWCARRGVESIVLGVRPWDPAREPRFATAVCDAIRWDWRYRIVQRRRDRGRDRLSDAQIGDLDGVCQIAHVAGRVAAVIRHRAGRGDFADLAGVYFAEVRDWLALIASGATRGVVPPSAPLFIEGATIDRPRGTCGEGDAMNERGVTSMTAAGRANERAAAARAILVEATPDELAASDRGRGRAPGWPALRGRRPAGGRVGLARDRRPVGGRSAVWRPACRCGSRCGIGPPSGSTRDGPRSTTSATAEFRALERRVVARLVSQRLDPTAERVLGALYDGITRTEAIAMRPWGCRSPR